MGDKSTKEKDFLKTHPCSYLKTRNNIYIYLVADVQCMGCDSGE